MQRYDKFSKQTESLSLQKHFEIIHTENAANSCLANLPGVEQLELLRSLIEIIAKRHAVPPFLDFNNLLSLGNS